MADHIVYLCKSMKYMTSVGNVAAGGVASTADSNISIVGADSGGADRLIVAASAGAIDSATFEGSSSWASDDADVTGEAPFGWNNTDTGVGGGISCGAGMMAAAGSSGNFTSTWSAATKQANGSLECLGTQTPETYDETKGAGADNVTVTEPLFGGGFYFLLFVQSANEPLATPTGWVKVFEIGTGTAAASGSTRLTIFTADADDSPTMPTLTYASTGTNVDPGGVASAEAFGTANIVVNVQPSGLATAEAFGTPSGLPFALDPSGVATGETFGTANATAVAAPSAVASAETFGTASVNAIVDATPAASAEAFGTAVIVDAVAPSGIASAEAHGSQMAVLVPSPSGIASAETFGTGKTDAAVDAAGVASAETFGTANMGTATLIDPSGIATGEAVGDPVLALILAASGVASGEVHGATSLASYVDPAGVASGEAHGAQMLATNVDPSGASSGEAFGSPTTRLTVDAQGVASAETFGTPVATALIAPQGIASLEAIGAVVLIQVINALGLASAEAFGTANVEVSGDFTIIVTGIPSAEAFGSARVDGGLVPVAHVIAAAVEQSIITSAVAQPSIVITMPVP